MLRKIFTWRNGVLASFAVFSVLFLTGRYYWMQQSEQWRQYQLGALAYRATAYETAVEYFDVSYAEYQRMSSQPQTIFTTPPSLEMAELSQHFKALALVKMGTEASTKLAVLTFKEALKLTTDDALAQATPTIQAELSQPWESRVACYDGSSGCMVTLTIADKIRQDRSFSQQDLEILFHNKPEQAQGEGKGRGGKGQAKQGDKQSEDPSNGNQAGKQDREAL